MNQHFLGATPTNEALSACAPYGGPGYGQVYDTPDPGTPDQPYSWRILCKNDLMACTGGAERETKCAVRLLPGMTCPARLVDPVTGECGSNMKKDASGHYVVTAATKAWHVGYKPTTGTSSGNGAGATTGGGGAGGGMMQDPDAPAGEVPAPAVETKSKLPWIMGGVLVAVAAVATVAVIASNKKKKSSK